MNKVNPIKRDALFPTLAALLRSPSHGHHKSRPFTEPLKVGVCVSGGPDSMVLAYLLKHASLRGVAGALAFQPLCFIIDHGARVGSNDEACCVQKSLSQLNITSKILRINWADKTEPSQLANFESEARRRRYQIIAHQCVTQGIRHVFLGHHLDDQIETLFMRLLQTGDRPLLGLQGIAPKTILPGCEDVFEAQNTSPPTSQKVAKGEFVMDDYESTAIQIHRPLLSFAKAEILATCQAYGIPFVTDSTNFDPILTTRNTVRYLRAHSELPLALRTTRILQLQQRAIDHRKALEIEGIAALKQIRLHRLDDRSGIVDIQIPCFTEDMSREMLSAFSYAFARIVELVTPSSKEDFPTLLNESITQGLLLPIAKKEKKMFQYAKTDFSLLSVVDFQGDKQTLWRLSRQPMRVKEISVNTGSFQIVTDRSNEGISKTEWLLWDRRYWVQLSSQNRDALSEIKIRPYLKTDVALLKERLSKSRGWNKFKEMIDEVASGKIRFTLPVLTLNDEVIAFPTLDFKLDGFNYLTWHTRRPVSAQIQISNT